MSPLGHEIVAIFAVAFTVSTISAILPPAFVSLVVLLCRLLLGNFEFSFFCFDFSVAKDFDVFNYYIGGLL